MYDMHVKWLVYGVDQDSLVLATVAVCHLNALQVPLGPVHVLTKYVYGKRVRHIGQYNLTIIAVQIRKPEKQDRVRCRCCLF